MSIRITQDNYPTYKKVFEIISRRLYGDLDGKLSPEIAPVNVLNRWEAQSKSVARRGLQAGLNDCLSSVSHYPKDMLSEINEELKRNMLPDILTLSGRRLKTLKQLLLTGEIKTIDQYYIVKEMLDDATSEISSGERDRLSVCMKNFETGKSR